MPTFLPNFNIKFNWWSASDMPFVGAPDLTDVDGQLYLHSKGDFDQTPGVVADWVPAVYIRLPADSVIWTSGPPLIASGFVWKDINGQNWHYVVRWWEWCHAKFANQYAQLLVEQCDDTGAIPDPNR